MVNDLLLYKMVLGNTELLLREALEDAFMRKKATGKEQLPQGVSRVEPFEPKSLIDRLHAVTYRVLYDVNGEVIVTMDDVPSKENYQKAIDTMNERMRGIARVGHRVPQLTLHDRTDALFEGLQQQGSKDYPIFFGDMLTARVLYTPQTPDQHKVAIYSQRDLRIRDNIELGTLLLANYLNLQQR